MVLTKRILWHVNRSPASKIIKLAMRARYRKELAKRRRLSALLPASAAARQVARDLRDNGFARVDDLIDRSVIAELGEAVERRALGKHGQGSTAFGNHKSFWNHLLEEEMVEGSLPAANPFVRFALQPKLLSALAEHYSELPRLDYVALTLSTHSGTQLKYSQLWHRDHDDTRVVKLFVYLTDVGPSDGPFTFMPGPESDKIGFSLHSHRQDAALARKLDMRKAIQMTGPRFSAFMVETSRCLHMGSRVEPGHQRLMYTASFISAPRIFPERKVPFFRLQGNESAVERCVLLPG